jgi:hypothetical protein
MDWYTILEIIISLRKHFLNHF